MVLPKNEQEKMWAESYFSPHFDFYRIGKFWKLDYEIEKLQEIPCKMYENVIK